jgi:hypothetical protein
MRSADRRTVFLAFIASVMPAFTWSFNVLAICLAVSSLGIVQWCRSPVAGRPLPSRPQDGSESP